MPVRLEKQNDSLLLTMRGLSGDDFQDALAVVRSITGRKWNAAEKKWEIPATYLNAEKLLHMVKPEISAEVKRWFEGAKSEVAGAVISDLPDDAELPTLPWADKLRPYQRAAVAFLIENKRAILADEMGLGKTIESIATVETEPINAGPRLVVCPNSVKKKWAREIYRWAGDDRRVVIIDGANPAKRAAQLKRAAEHSAWVIINWEKLRIMPDLAKIKWAAVIADEAHRAKNRKAKQTKALWKIQAPIQLALTGTPIQNSPDELWAILKWLYPKEYTSYWRFFNDYVDYYEGYFGRIITGVKNPDVLRYELKDRMVRRTKDKVLNLPPITYTEIPVELSRGQRAIYKEVEKELWVQIKRDAEAGDKQAQRFLSDPIYFIENGAARTTRLRQVASTPALLGGKDDSAKLDAAAEIIADAPDDKQFVVFTEFKGTAELLAARVGDAAAFLHGETTQTERDFLIDEFQAGRLRVLAMTRDTGGEGIDLYRADTAIFIERHWTPARNEQAESRLHRFGQENPVQIINLVATDTIDDGKVEPTNERKSKIVRTILE